MEPKYYMSFDIETTPLDWNTFSESQKEYWLRGAKTDEEIDELIASHRRKNRNQ